MTEATDSTPRRELWEEYFKVMDILQSYDPYFLTIKNWGVTVSGAAIALSVSQKSSSAFLLVCVLAVGFCTTEVRFKLLQLGHTLRATERDLWTRCRAPNMLAVLDLHGRLSLNSTAMLKMPREARPQKLSQKRGSLHQGHLELKPWWVNPWLRQNNGYCVS